MPNPDSLVFVLGIDPGTSRPTSLAAWTVLSLDLASGAVSVRRQAVHRRKAELPELLSGDPLLSDPRLRIVAIAAPLTPSPLDRKPRKARSVELRLSRGAFSGTARGPWMPWICDERTWPRYLQAAQLQAILRNWDLPLLTMPAVAQSIELPLRSVVEVYPKATLALLSSTDLRQNRPAANRFKGQLDDWLFPKLFANPTPALPEFLSRTEPPVMSCLKALALDLLLTSEFLGEAQRLSRLRRPFPRREPIRAFTAAFQGLLALRGGACLVGAPGEQEGAILLPAIWHPEWEVEWNDARKVPQLRRIPVHPPSIKCAPRACRTSFAPTAVSMVQTP